ncbi:hypothetical protein [Synechococcus sp. MIT S9503]
MKDRSTALLERCSDQLLLVGAASTLRSSPEALDVQICWSVACGRGEP